MFALPQDKSVLLSVVAICWVTLAFFIYTLLQSRIRKFFLTRSKNRTAHPDNSLSVLLQRITGVFLYGFVSVVLIIFIFKNPASSYGFEMKNSLITGITVLLLLFVVVPLSLFTSRSPGNLDFYPQIRVKEWNSSLLIVSALSWIAYLLAYEFMYRGFLLFSCYHAFGTWPAIIINTSLYSLTHLVKNKREGVGAFFIGIILCILVLHIGSLWVAFYVHVIMALSNEWFSIRAHPEMNFKFKNRKLQ
jgi:membrane protease YdiL (CAAX protease family)